MNSRNDVIVNHAHCDNKELFLKCFLGWFVSWLYDAWQRHDQAPEKG